MKWIYCEDSGRVRDLKTDELVAIVAFAGSQVNVNGEIDAKGRLMAAAPQMLEALKATDAMFLEMNQLACRELREQIRNAIKAAEDVA